MEKPASDLPTVPLDSVREGDLIFTARPSGFQHLVEIAGDPWRHVGVAAIVDGEMSICEVAGHEFTFRPLERVARPPHTAIGVARFDDDLAACARSAARWTMRMLEEENLYAWDDLMLTGILLLVRRRAPARLFGQVMQLINEAERLATERPPAPGQRSFTCASFVHHAYAQAGRDCAPAVTIDPVRSRPARFRDGNDDPPLTLAELVAAAERGDTDALIEPLASFSILELSGVVPRDEVPRTRSTDSSRINPDQFVRSVRYVARVFAGVRTEDLPERLVLDERWVSPGDLWNLDELSMRALLPLSDEEDPSH